MHEFHRLGSLRRGATLPAVITEGPKTCFQHASLHACRGVPPGPLGELSAARVCCALLPFAAPTALQYQRVGYLLRFVASKPLPRGSSCCHAKAGARSVSGATQPAGLS